MAAVNEIKQYTLTQFKSLVEKTILINITPSLAYFTTNYKNTILLEFDVLIRPFVNFDKSHFSFTETRNFLEDFLNLSDVHVSRGIINILQAELVQKFTSVLNNVLSNYEPIMINSHQNQENSDYKSNKKRLFYSQYDLNYSIKHQKMCS